MYINEIGEMEESLRLLNEEEEQNQQTYEQQHPKEFKKFKVKRGEWRNSAQKEARRLQAARHRERYASIRKEIKRLEAIELQKLGFLPPERPGVVRIKVKKLVEIPLSDAIKREREETYFAKIDAELMAEDNKQKICKRVVLAEEGRSFGLRQCIAYRNN